MIKDKLIIQLLFLIILTSLFSTIFNTVVVVTDFEDNDFPEARCVVSYVVDGDTFYCSPAPRNSTYIQAKIRLADINAPELGTPEGNIAKQALEDLILGRIVYLDIDDKYGTDIYGRWVAVAYLRVNETYVMNINKWLVENGYASIVDYDNQFNPANWSLYEYYPLSYDNYPSMYSFNVTNISPSYPSHGVSYSVSPNNQYVGYVYGLYNDYRIHAIVVDQAGEPLFNTTFDDTDVYYGMIRMAMNDTGFLMVWTNYTYDSYYKTVLYSYVPLDPYQPPTPPKPLYPSSYQYAPMVGYGYNKYIGSLWLVTYITSSTSNILLYWYILDSKLSVIGSGSIPITPSGVDYQDKPDVGVDYYSGVIYDPVSNSFYVTVRTLSSTTGYDIGFIKIYASDTGWTSEYIPLDDDAGDQGPPAKTLPNGYKSYILEPNIYTTVIPEYGFILVVYNKTSSSLNGVIYDLVTGDTSEITIATGLSSYNLYYPRIAAGKEWLVSFVDNGDIYASIVYPNTTAKSMILVTEINTDYPVPVFNGVNYTLVFGVTNGSQYDLFAVNILPDGTVMNYAFPVFSSPDSDTVPYPVVLNNQLIVLHKTGSSTVLTVLSAPTSNPQPIPESQSLILMAAITSIILVVILIIKPYFIKKR